MIKKYNGYEQAEAYTGEYEKLEPGGYICKILKVQSEDKDYGTLLRIAFDIEEGEHKGYYKRTFENKKESNPDTKWPGMYYQTVKESDLKYFKGFVTSIEASNKGYKWDWDEKKLVGKIFGGVFGEEEFVTNDGEIKTSVKCRFVRSADSIREGKFKVPDIKKLQGSSSTSTNNGWVPADNDDELPF